MSRLYWVRMRLLRLLNLMVSLKIVGRGLYMQKYNYKPRSQLDASISMLSAASKRKSKGRTRRLTLA